jgi:hypothetical protein
MLGTTANSTAPGNLPRTPDFIDLERYEGVTRVRFAVELRFDLETGRVGKDQHAALSRDEPG